MTLTVLIFAALSFFLALVCSWAILLPFFETADHAAENLPNPQAESLAELRIRKETMLDALEDLENDYLTKRVDDEDYAEAKNELTIEASAVLSSMELLGDHRAAAGVPLPQKKRRQ